jgi:hypothetical protein
MQAGEMSLNTKVIAGSPRRSNRLHAYPGCLIPERALPIRINIAPKVRDILNLKFRNSKQNF